MRRFDPDRGDLWPWVRASFWRYMLDQMKRWNSQRAHECPASELINGHFGGWTFIEDKKGLPPDKLVLQRERIDAVNAAIRELSERDQGLVVFRHHLGLHVTDIAELLEYPTVNAASQAIIRATNKLADLLRPEFQND